MAQRRLPNSRPEDADAVGLPQRPFLYTLDQIATLLAVDEAALRASVHFEGRSVGARPVKKMLARNIAPEGRRPDWRVAERELIRWLRTKGFRFYERGWVLI